MLARKNSEFTRADKGDSGYAAELSKAKIQPQALELEELVLGAILIDKDALPVVIDIIKPDSFYSTSHQLIYKAMLSLFEKSQPVDLLLVTQELTKAGDLERIGGPYNLAKLTNRVVSAANVEYHARIIAQKYIQRSLIRVSTTIIRDAYADTTDVFELLDNAEQGLFNITQNNLSKSYQPLSSLTAITLKNLEALSQQDKAVTGVPTGFAELDQLTSGWQPSDLVIVAARPGMGKSSFCMKLAKNAADLGKGVAIFSLEMSNIQLVQRLVAIEAEVSSEKLRNGNMDEEDWRRVQSAIEILSETPMYIDDTPGLNIFELRAKCRRLKMQNNIEMVIIDYLQLMTGDQRKNGNREQEISSISRGLKALAKELNVPVIALSQLSRAVETRGGTKRPQLSDLRDSGSIEQDADIVSFIYRPEYYSIIEDEEGQSLKGIAEIIVAKHRNGALRTVKLNFVDQYTDFREIESLSNQFPLY